MHVCCVILNKVSVSVTPSIPNSNRNANFQSRFISYIGVVLSNGTLLSNKSGSVKERIKTIDNFYVL